MNINKINKINKLIINNKEILNIKYKERNDILENASNKTKNYIINDLEKIDKYIEDIEFENQKLEKELEELKNLYDLDVNLKKNKTQLCKYYKSSKGCDKGNKCSFAHSENELRCMFDEYCVNGECKRVHLRRDKNGITKYNNKEITVIDNNVKKINEENKIPEIQLTINANKYYDDNYINKIQENKEIIKNEANRNNCKTDNIEYNNYSKFDKVESLNINTNQEIGNIKLSIINIEDNTIELVNHLQETLDKYIKEIKRNIDETFLDDKKQYGTRLKLDLNKISSELILFKNNFEDIIFIEK